MTYNIQNQVFQKFINGPTQSTDPNGSFEEGNGEKVPHRADLTPANASANDVNAPVYDSDILYNEANERYD